MLIKSYIQDPSGKRVEMTADKDIYSEIFTQVHTSGPWIEFAIDDCSLWSFLYYLYLDLIYGYMDKPEFEAEKHRKEYEVLIVRLKDNIIDEASLTLLRDTLLKFKAASPDRPVGISKSLKGATLEDALGKYYDLAIEALGCCDAAKYVNPYQTESNNSATWHDGTTEVEYELVYSLPELSYRCCALAELEDMGVLEGKWFENDNKDGKTALYRHILELSAKSDGFNKKTLYLLDLAARCLEPFVNGQIRFTTPYEPCSAPGTRAKKLQKMFDSFDEDLPEDTTGNTTKQQQIHPSI